MAGRVLDKAAAMGFQADFGTEAEFFVLKDGGDDGARFSPLALERPSLDKPAYDVARVLDNMHWLGELVEMMNGLGWDVYSFDHEDGVGQPHTSPRLTLPALPCHTWMVLAVVRPPAETCAVFCLLAFAGQFETDFKFTDALSAADRLVFLRWMSGEVARKHGGFASWMPKPAGHMAGSGCHFNISLGSADGSIPNLFKLGANGEDEEDPYGFGLSPLGYSFVAGMQRHLPSITAVSAPTVNSYKRLIARGSNSGFTWAPIFQSWGTLPFMPASRPVSRSLRLTLALWARRWQQPLEHAALQPGPRRAACCRLLLQPVPRLRHVRRRGPRGHRGEPHSSAAKRGQPLRADGRLDAGAVRGGRRGAAAHHAL